MSVSETAAERRRRATAKAAFQRLADGSPLMRRELFKDPSSGHHLSESWELRFLRYLESQHLVDRRGNRYQINNDNFPDPAAKAKAMAIMKTLLENEGALSRLLFTTEDPLKGILGAGEAPVAVEAASTEQEEPSPPSAEPMEKSVFLEDGPPPQQERALLELIAERLLLTLNALVRIREDHTRLEKKVDTLLEGLGVKVEGT